MKKLLVLMAVLCMSLFAGYAQRDIPAGGSMEVASVESNDNHFTLYKIKDKEGNPSFYLSASYVTLSLNMETFGTETSISAAEGSLLFFGTSYEEAMVNLDALLALFGEQDGAQLEFTCLDGKKALFTLHKGLLGKHLSIGEASMTKSDVKSLKFSFKLSKKLHPDL